MSKMVTNAVSNVKIRDFCSKKKLILITTIAVIAACLLGIIIRGVNVAIEFKGGTVITYNYTGDIDTGKAEDAVKSIVNTPVSIRTGENIENDGKQVTVSFTSNEGLTADRQSELTAALQAAFPDSEIELSDSNDVNPTTGKEFFLKCLVAVLFAALLIII